MEKKWGAKSRVVEKLLVLELPVVLPNTLVQQSGIAESKVPTLVESRLSASRQEVDGDEGTGGRCDRCQLEPSLHPKRTTTHKDTHSIPKWAEPVKPWHDHNNVKISATFNCLCCLFSLRTLHQCCSLPSQESCNWQS